MQQHIDAYHRWYYESQVWTRVTYLGVACQKSVSDMWNYQEILAERKVSLVVEFGTRTGGSALFFSHILQTISPASKVLTVDCDPSQLDHKVRHEKHIESLVVSTTDPVVAERIESLRIECPGPLFAILDGNHQKDHVLAELTSLRRLLVTGDYVVVEDGNINGHPVLPGWGEGPCEAIQEYERRYPGDFEHDLRREMKFGFTFAPNGFLIKR